MDVDKHLLKQGVLLRIEKILFETIQMMLTSSYLLRIFDTEEKTQNYVEWLEDKHLIGNRKKMLSIIETLDEQLSKIQTKINNPEQYKKAIVNLSRSNEALNPLYVKSEENYYPQEVPSRVLQAPSPRRNVKKNKPRSPTKVQEIVQIKAKNRQERLLQEEQDRILQEQLMIQQQQLVNQAQINKVLEQEEYFRKINCKVYQELLEEGVKLRRKEALLMRSSILENNKEKRKEAGKLERQIRDIAKEMALLNIPCDPTINNKDLPTWYDEQIVIENEFQIRIAKEKNKQPYFPYAPLVPYERLRKKSPERTYPSPF